MRASISLTSTFKINHLLISICQLNNISEINDDDIMTNCIKDVYVNKDFFLNNKTNLLFDSETESNILIAYDTNHFEIRVFNQSPRELKKLTEKIVIRLYRYGKINGYQQSFSHIDVYEDKKNKHSIYKAYFGLGLYERILKTIKDKITEILIVGFLIIVFGLSAVFFQELFNKWIGAIFVAIFVQSIQVFVHFIKLGSVENIHWEIPK